MQFTIFTPLKLVAGGFCLMNDSLSLIRWIYPVGNAPKPQRFTLHPGITLLTYAVLEPVFYKLLFWSAIPPDYILSAAVAVHLHASIIMVKLADDGTAEDEAFVTSSQDEEKSAPPESSTNNPTAPAKVPGFIDSATLIIPTITLALCNGAVELFAQSLLLPPPSMDASWPRIISNYAALIQYISTIYANSHFGVFVGRPYRSGPTSMVVLLAFGVTAFNAVPRLLLGLHALSQHSGIDTKAVEAMMLGCDDRYAWFYDLGVSPVSWILPLWLLAQVVVGYGLWKQWVEQRERRLGTNTP